MVDAQIADDKTITLHCPNTGSMKNCLYEASTIWYSDSGNPKRKYPCTFEMAEVPVLFGDHSRQCMAGVNTSRANALVIEAIENGIIKELQGYSTLKPEQKYGEENSRIDILLTAEHQPDCYVEVKNVTMALGNGTGCFPDAVTSRGTKHLRELIRVAQNGERAVVFFCVQHTGIEVFRSADDIDPEYGQTLREAASKGVEILAYGADLSPKEIALKFKIFTDL